MPGTSGPCARIQRRPSSRSSGRAYACAARARRRPPRRAARRPGSAARARRRPAPRRAGSGRPRCGSRARTTSAPSRRGRRRAARRAAGTPPPRRRRSRRRSGGRRRRPASRQAADAARAAGAPTTSGASAARRSARPARHRGAAARGRSRRGGAARPARPARLLGGAAMPAPPSVSGTAPNARATIGRSCRIASTSGTQKPSCSEQTRYADGPRQQLCLPVLVDRAHERVVDAQGRREAAAGLAVRLEPVVAADDREPRTGRAGALVAGEGAQHLVDPLVRHQPADGHDQRPRPAAPATARCRRSQEDRQHLARADAGVLEVEGVERRVGQREGGARRQLGQPGARPCGRAPATISLTPSNQCAGVTLW